MDDPEYMSNASVSILDWSIMYHIDCDEIEKT